MYAVHCTKCQNHNWDWSELKIWQKFASDKQKFDGQYFLILYRWAGVLKS